MDPILQRLSLRRLFALLCRLLRRGGLSCLRLLTHIFSLVFSETKLGLTRPDSRDPSLEQKSHGELQVHDECSHYSPPQAAASLLPPNTHHPYGNSAVASMASTSASLSSHDIEMQPISGEPYTLLPVNDLPQTLPQIAVNGVLDRENSPAATPYASRSASVTEFLADGPSTRELISESPVDMQGPGFGFGGPPASPPWLNKLHPQIYAGVPEDFARYSRRTPIKNEKSEFTINPMTMHGRANNPSKLWRSHHHPEGTPYFIHAERRVFTDANLYDPEILEFIDLQLHNITDTLRAKNLLYAMDPHDVDIVLEYAEDQMCEYYFVKHSTRMVFWLDPAQSSLFPIARARNGIKSPSQIRHVLEAQYWYHCLLFPRSLHVQHALMDELRDLVSHARGDLLTSAKSPVSLTAEDLNQMSALLDSLTKNVGSELNKKWDGTSFTTEHAVDRKYHAKLDGLSCIVARLMQDFVMNRVSNFHGEIYSRLQVDQSVYSTLRRRTPLIRLFSPFLFYAPDSHLETLHKTFIDGLVRRRGWAEFVSRLMREWYAFMRNAAVVLNADVAFLSIQSVDTGGIITPFHTPTQILSYMSMLASIAAIITGMLLVKQNRNREEVPPVDAATYLGNRHDSAIGLETLAIMYSLPYALLIWSTFLFLAAFLFMCFDHSDLSTRASIAVLSGVIALLILWCALSGWDAVWQFSWTSSDDSETQIAPSRSPSPSPITEEPPKPSQSSPARKSWRKSSWLSWVRPRPERDDTDTTVVGNGSV